MILSAIINNIKLDRVALFVIVPTMVSPPSYKAHQIAPPNHVSNYEPIVQLKFLLYFKVFNPNSN